MKVPPQLALLGITLAIATSAHADEGVTLTLMTSPTKFPKYEPRNVLAVWVQDASGKFVRTLMRYGERRVKHLRAWNAVALDSSQIDSDPDVITGATRPDHRQEMIRWDLTDFRGNPVPDGTYTIRMELSDHDAFTASTNNQGTFSLDKNGSSAVQTGMANGGFLDVTIAYSAESDPIPPSDSDPEEDCPPAAECRDDDGCCSPDCVYDVDNDCDPATSRDAPAGCSTGGAPPVAGWALLSLTALALAARRRSRRRS